ncbi:MAG: hypothetical protein ACW99F_06110 [Candidatus Hodarchaeales archaeon]
MSDPDLGNFIMKLFDPLLAESKNQLTESRDSFLRSIPRQISAHSSVPVYQAENFVKDMANQLIKINQDLLNQYSISIAKKSRSEAKKSYQSKMTDSEEQANLLLKKEAEIEGLQKMMTTIEKRAKNLETEKEETMRQFSRMNSVVKDLESKLSIMKMQYEKQIQDLTSEWEEKFQKNQEEWDSYVKLKIAEKEVQTSVTQSTTEE